MLYILAFLFPPVATAIAHFNSPPQDQFYATMVTVLCCIFGFYLGGIVYAWKTVDKHAYKSRGY